MALNCRHLERLTSLTIVHGMLTCYTGLHIGTGEGVSPGASDLPVAKDGLERPYIPGSSLKGVLRSYAERLIYSLTPLDSPPQNRSEMPAYLSRFERRFTSCLLHSETPYCLSTSRAYKDEFERRRERGGFESDDILTHWILSRTCSVCQLFGSPNLAGRLWVRDGGLVEQPAPLEVRDGIAIERDRRAAAAHLKFDLEVVPPTTAFDLEIRVENATDAELGILFLILDQLNEGEVRLGGRSSAGLGRVGFHCGTLLHLDTSNREALLGYLLWQPDHGDRPGTCSQEQTQALRERAKAAFAQKIREGWSDA